MLAGWIDDPKQIDLLTKMLDNERVEFVANPYVANSVAEDIMFAATRWSQRPPGKVREAGIFVLAEMVYDALSRHAVEHGKLGNCKSACGHRRTTSGPCSVACCNRRATRWPGVPKDRDRGDSVR